eukprot:31339-Prorocentrum_minimum.AAC.1
MPGMPGMGMGSPTPMQQMVMTGAAPAMMDGMPDMSQVGPPPPPAPCSATPAQRRVSKPPALRRRPSRRIEPRAPAVRAVVYL